MKKLLLLLSFLWFATGLSAQSITYSDAQTGGTVTFVPDAAQTNGKISFSSDVVAGFSYKLFWCATGPSGVPSWRIGSPGDPVSLDCAGLQSYWRNTSNTTTPPPTGWIDDNGVGGTLVLYFGPTLTTNAASVSGTSVTMGGDVSANGSSALTAHGVVYGASANPAIGGLGVTQQVISGTATPFSGTYTLAASTSYHYRAYATNGSVTSYGADATFTTGAASAATITATGTLAAVNTTYGTTSATPASFVVGGTNLTSNLVVTPPTTDFEVSTSSGSGYGATVTLSPTSGTVSNTTIYLRLKATAAAGTYASANVTISSTGATSKTLATASSTVTTAALIITATGPSKTYGTALIAGTSTINFIAGTTQNGETVTGVTLAPNAAGLSATTTAGSAYTVSPSAATGSGGFLASNYNITYTPYDGTVMAAPITVTATGPSKTYSAALTAGASITNFTVTGTLAGGEALTSVTLIPNAAGLSAATAAGSAYVVTPSAATGTGGFLASNYNITYTPFSGTVTAAPLTVTATGPAKAYGAALTAGTSTTNFTVGTTQNGETVMGVTLTPDAAGLSATTAAGSAFVVTPSAATGTGGFLASNYNITYTPFSGTVSAAALAVTATGPAKAYGTALTAGTSTINLTISGTLAGGQALTSVTLTPDAAGLSASTAAGSAYVVTPSAATGTGGFLASNYNITYTPFSGTVSTAPLTVTATGPAKAYGTALTAGTSTTNFTVTGTLAGGQALTSVTLIPDAAGLSASTAAGSAYVVTPSAATGTGGFLTSNYNITYTPFSGTVGTASLTVTATGPAKAYGTALTAGTSTTNFSVTGTPAGGEALTSVTMTPNAAGLSATTAAGSAYVVTPSGATGTGGFLASNYNITYTPFSGTVTAVPLTVTATGPAKTYGTALTAGTSTTNFTVTGTLAGGQALTSVTLTPDAAGLSTTTAAGSAFAVTPSAATGTGGFLASNYNITYTPFSGTVSAAALAVTATGPAKAYGTALTAGTSTTNFTVTGTLAGGQALTSVTLTPDAAGLSASSAVGAAYAVTPSAATGTGGFLASNYNITYTSFSGTVSTAPLTVTATGPVKTYGTALAAGTSTTNFIVTGTLGAGQALTSVTLTPNAAGLSATTAAGSAYVVTPSAATGTGGFLASNYNITYTPFSGTVSTAPLTAIATGPAKAYGTALTAGTSTTNFTVTGTPASGEALTNVTLTPDAAGLSATTAAGSAYVVTPSAATGTGGFLASNYNITYTPFSGTVSAAALAVTATGPAKAYGTALTAGTSTTSFTVSGTLAGGQALTSVTLTPDAAGLSASTAAGAAYAVTPSAATGTGGFLASNYNITYTPFSGTVSTAPLTVTATGPAKAYGTVLTAGTSTTNFTVTGTLGSGQALTSVTLTPDAAGLSATTAAGSAYVVTPSVATGTGGFLASNYNITYIPFSGTVGAASLTVTATGPAKSYGTALTAGTSTTNFSITGTPASGQVLTSITLTPNAAGLSATTAAGSAYVVTPSAATGTGGFLAGNYNITYTPFSSTVTVSPLTISANNVDKTPGATLTSGAGSAAFTTIPASMPNSETIGSVTITYGTGSGSGAGAGTYTGSVIPSLATGGTFTASNYNITYAAGDIVIGSPVVTAAGTLAAVSTAYGMASATPTSFVVGGSNLTANLVVTPPTTDYEVSTSAATGYGATVSVAPASGTVSNTTVYLRLKATTPAGTYATGSVTVASGATSQILAVASSTVSAATLTYIASTSSKIYGSANPTLSGTITGFVNGDTQGTATTGTAAFATTAITASPVGNYAINGSGLSAANYTFVQATSSATALTVTPVTLTYTANTASKVYGSANPTLSGSINGFVNGDNQATSTTGTAAFTTTATAASGVGSYAITGLGVTPNGNYTITQATGNASALSATPATLSYVANTASKAFSAANPVLSGSVTGFVNGDTQASVTTGTLNFTTTATAASAVGSYPVTGSGITPNSNYTISQSAGNATALTVGTAILSYTANAASKTYGAANPALSGSVTGFVNGDTQASATTGTLNFTTTATAAGAVGSYPVTGSGITPNSNYTISQSAGNATALTVGTAALTITAGNQSKTYGAVNPTLSVSYSGFVNGDNSASLTTLPSLTTTATSASAAGTYPVIASGATIANYTIIYAPGTLTINKATLTITADNKSRLYGIANPVLTFAYSGFVNGDSEISLATLPVLKTVATTISAPGTYRVTISGAISSNYNFNYIPGQLTITPLSNADLISMTPSSGTLSPVFTTGNFTYTAQVNNDVDRIQLIPTFDPTAVVRINGTSTPNGSSSYSIPLDVGNNTIDIIVTAQDHVTIKTYTVTIYRGVAEETIVATNILTPNGDGKNDSWMIQDIQLYPNNTVTIYDKAGRIIFSKHGYNNDWDGTLKGAPLVQGTYYYTVDLGVGKQLHKGFITILKSR